MSATDRDAANELISRVRVSVQTAHNCPSAIASFEELVSIFVDGGVMIVEGSEAVRDSRLNEVWGNAAHYLRTTFSDCYDDPVDMAFSIDEASELLDRSGGGPRRREVSGISDDLREAMGPLPDEVIEGNACDIAAQAAVSIILEDCMEE